MTIHTWNPNNTDQKKLILNSDNYVDRMPFVPGDTLIVNAGSVAANPSEVLTVDNLPTGNFLFDRVGGSSEDFLLDNVQLNSSSKLVIAGNGKVDGIFASTFTNNGLLQVGTEASSGALNAGALSVNDGITRFINNSEVLVERGSLFNANMGIINTKSGLVKVESGSTLNSGFVSNEGSIVVGSPAGQATNINLAGLVGSGVLSLQAGVTGDRSLVTVSLKSLGSNIDIAGGNVVLSSNPYQGSTIPSFLICVDGAGFRSTCQNWPPHL